VISEEETREERIVYERNGAEGSEDDDRERIQLEDGGEDVGGDVDPETEEPERASMWGTLLRDGQGGVLNVRLALDREA
jgi:hypothetical protein